EKQEDIGQIIKANNIDIVINDILNTSKKYITYLKTFDVKVINYEDLGDGADIADAVINDLYEEANNRGNHFYWGSDYYILRDEFLLSKPGKFNKKVKNILVIFGGVDPSNLTQKLFDSIPYIYDYDNYLFTIIVGPGYPFYHDLKN